MRFTIYDLRFTIARLVLAFAIICLPSSILAAELITATVSFTNAAGTTNGQTIAINASTRTWTNNVVIPDSQILTNDSPEGSATNLYQHLGFSPVAGTSASYGSSTSVVVRGFPGSALTITLSDGYGAVAYATNTITSAVVLRLPVTVESGAQQTNITTRLVDALNLTAPTNQLMQASPAFAQLVGTTNAQTISGAKTWSGNNAHTGSNDFSGFVTTVTITNSSHAKFGGDVQVIGNLDVSGIVADGSITSSDTIVGILQGDGSSITNISGANIVSGVASAALRERTVHSMTATGTNSFSDIAFRRYAITSLANGNNAGVVVGTNTFVQVSGPSGAFTLNGFTGSPNRDGHVVKILNRTGQNMTIANDSGTEPVAANRIYTLTGADVGPSTGDCIATFIYSAADSRWILESYSP